ncbi:MAG: hypothetical protein HY896_07585 [Deltaproteobacteria bacterium]|nr:hypothetical protein [Deltaproteobacteria bacterium]
MKNTCRNVSFLAVLLLWIGSYGCASGNVISLPDGPSRPAAKEVPKAEGSPAVAVVDFTWKAHPDSEIGRDYDNVRAIVWKGDPGKALADLVAGVLAEKGVSTVRAAGDGEIPAGVPVKIRGRVEEFRVNARRIALGTAVEIEANTALRIEGSGPGAPAGWSTTVSSSYRYPEPLFIMTGDILHAVNRASNDVAEEAVRQLMKSGLVAVHESPAAITNGAAPAEETPGPGPANEKIEVEEVK